MRTGLLALLVLLLLVVGGVSYIGWRQSVPGVVVTFTPPRFLGRQTSFPLAVEARGGQVAQLEVRVVQADRPAVALREEGTLGRRLERSVTVDSAALGLREGAATIEIWARDDFWRPFRFDDRARARYPVTVDLTPPRVEILAATRYLAQGGSGLVVFRVGGAERATVRVGSLGVPSFPVGRPERGVRVALLALPWDLAPDTPLAVSAVDEAGNATTRGIPVEIRRRRFPRDTVEIGEALLRAKVPELLPQHPADRPLIEGFLRINREQRAEAEAQKRTIAAATADRPLWQGPFVQPRNTKVFANFAETRRYLYQGNEIDTQVHYGYDLASTRRAPAPAAAAGRVVFAGPLTIYGNTVVVDHGWGLQTLYAHLSTIGVTVGDTVTQGQELGRTGATGLAVGDHLHFEVLIHGISVTPLEWWDARWLQDHIAAPLAQAGLPPLGSAEASAAEPADAASR